LPTPRTIPVTAPPTRHAGLARIVTAALLVASLAAFVHGWLQEEMHAKLAWHPDGAARAALLSGAYWAVCLAIVATGRRALPFKFALAAALALAYCAGPLPVLASAFLFASACALGCGVLSRGGRSVLPASDLPLATALGLGVIGSLGVVLGLWHVNSPFTYMAMLTLPLLWQGRALFALLGTTLQRECAASWRELLLLGAIGNLALLNVTVALLPEVGHDALAFHLAVVAHVHDFGYWHYDVRRALLAVTPLAIHYLYAAAYMFAGEMAARLVNVGTLLTALALVHATLRGFAGRSAALVAALVAAASPIALLESASLFIDNAWALLVTGTFVAFLQFARGGDAVRLVAGGLLFGAALAAKFISVAALPGIALMLGLALRQRGARLPWSVPALAVAAGLALAAPPYVIAFVKTGNPVFPFLNGVFKSPLYIPADMPHVEPSLNPLLPYWMTFHTDRHLEAVPGAFGFEVLLLGPAVLFAAVAWGRREGAAMGFAALSFALVVAANVAYVRYVYPALFPFAIALGATLGGGTAAGWTIHAFRAVAGIALVANILFLPAGFAPSRFFDLAPVVDPVARHEYVGKWAAPRHVVPLLNALPDQETTVAYFGGQPFVAQVRRRAVVDFYTHRFHGRVGKIKSQDDLVRLVGDFDLGYIVLDAQLEPRLRGMVESVATRVAKFGDSTVYRITGSARYPVERLAGPRMEIEPGAWNMHGAVPRDPQTGVVLVDHDHVLWQRVPIVAGRPYRYAVQVRCHREPADVRLQVIWHRPDGSTSLSFRTVGCLPEWVEEEAVFTAPADAVHAVVFATGHGKEKVEVRSVSFRAKLVAP
jgi:hypothetical protein